jgi:phosphoribosylcarboxyaminoimidazole (NCAIR) mutase
MTEMIWEPDGWHKTPTQMANEAKAKNESAYNIVAANAGKHSNPPNDPHMRVI